MRVPFQATPLFARWADEQTAMLYEIMMHAQSLWAVTKEHAVNR